jgi:hypothetical protein
VTRSSVFGLAASAPVQSGKYTSDFSKHAPNLRANDPAWITSSLSILDGFEVIYV